MTRIHPPIQPQASDQDDLQLMRDRLYLLCTTAFLICTTSLLVLFICSLMFLGAL